MTNLGSFSEKKTAKVGYSLTPVCVKLDDLPLSCPMPDHAVTNLHPKVYLPIKATGSAVCPYCSTRYQLKA
ncbi:MAG: hypothetical protein RLZ35_808 [Pseudomonadota bacterium]|jgi:uncharacterized Zn-finger protein